MGTEFKRDVKFTQYLMPDGRQQQVVIDRPNEVVDKADELNRLGFRFELEMLSDYRTVSLTVAKDDEDVEIELCDNGPEIPAAVDRLIERAYRAVKGEPVNV